MKERVVVALILAGFMVGLVGAQSGVRGVRQAQKPKFDEKLGTCNLTGFSEDAVWAAALKALKLDQFEIVKTTKGMIIAQMTKGDRAEVDVYVTDHPDPPSSLRPWSPCVTLGVHVPIHGDWETNNRWTSEQRRTTSRHLYEKITDILYAPPAK
jgi:hypothetical protein